MCKRRGGEEAFGCLLYEMLTGKRVGLRPCRLPSRKLEKVLSRCLEEDPARRWQSAVELERELAGVTAAESVPAGPFASANGPVTIAAEFCRVAMVVKPSDDSDIRVEIWLPVAAWNGKFQGIGNGGFAGSIDFAALAAAVANGYAAASTDSGHHAGGTDARRDE